MKMTNIRIASARKAKGLGREKDRKRGTASGKEWIIVKVCEEEERKRR